MQNLGVPIDYWKCYFHWSMVNLQAARDLGVGLHGNLFSAFWGSFHLVLARLCTLSQLLWMHMFRWPSGSRIHCCCTASLQSLTASGPWDSFLIPHFCRYLLALRGRDVIQLSHIRMTILKFLVTATLSRCWYLC